MTRIEKLFISIIIIFNAMLTVSYLQINAKSCSPSVNHVINRQIHRMTYRQKVGQMLIYPSSPDNTTRNYHMIHGYNVGGIIMYGFLNNQNKSEFSALQKASHNSLLLGTDQEGGYVSRLGINHKLYPSPQEAYQRNGIQGIFNAYKYSSQKLRSIGINWNFAPDADVSNPQGIIYYRTFGKGPKWNARCTSKVVPIIQHEHVAATLKHFPGYGSVKKNSDIQVTRSNASLNYLIHHDFLPFKHGIKAGADSIMINNIIYDHIQHNVPATLSRRIINLLRHQLHFHGVIVTDSLDAFPVRQYCQRHNISAAYLAISAGNDMIMTKHYFLATHTLINDIKKGYLSKGQINQSVFRILYMKYKLGLNY